MGLYWSIQCASGEVLLKPNRDGKKNVNHDTKIQNKKVEMMKTTPCDLDLYRVNKKDDLFLETQPFF